MSPEEINRKLIELGFRRQSASGAELARIEAEISNLQRQLALARMRSN